MKLDFEQIKDICTGAERLAKDGDGVRFYRFSEREDALYEKRSADFHMKSRSTAGVRLCFCTDSKSLRLCGSTELGSSRYYYSIDVFVNGKPLGYIDNYSDTELPASYAKLRFELGAFSGEFDLGEGEKEVCIYLPWSVAVRLDELSIDDGASICAVKSEKVLLAYGDSITQGYDALRPSNRYTSKICDAIGAYEINTLVSCFLIAFFRG